MQKIKDFCKRHRLLWLTLLVALAAAAVAAWAGFDLGQRVDNQPVYEIVNDDYTRTVVIPATADAATQDDGTTGLYLPVPLKSGQRIYGVRLDLTTHNWAFRHGTLYAALLDADANLALPGKRWPVGPIAKVLALVLAAIGWVQVNMGAALYAARDVDTVGILRAGGAAAAGAALLALLYWKIRRDPKKKKIFLGAIAAVVVLAIPVGLYKLTHMWGGLTPDQLVGSIQENGDSIYTYSAGYICRNLPNTGKLLLRSFSAQGAQWVQGVLGTALGEPIVYTVDASWVLGVGSILALLAAALPQAGETVPLGRRTKAGVWGIVLCVIALSFVTALNWTPINYTTIFGLQGRYWLPVLPLVLALVHHNRTVAVQKPAERKAVFAMLCLTSFVILQGAGLYATFQMPS